MLTIEIVPDKPTYIIKNEFNRVVGDLFFNHITNEYELNPYVNGYISTFTYRHLLDVIYKLEEINKNATLY